MTNCQCDLEKHTPQLIVLTGGPGAGKTAVLEMVKKIFCEHVAILPEAASIIFGGGFWREDDSVTMRAAQRAIFHVQEELESIITQKTSWALGLCDRGTLDGWAYWPGDKESYWQELKITKKKEYGRYAHVVHLRTPKAGNGYNHQNPIRVETPEQAYAIDCFIQEIWKDHPSYTVIDATLDFRQKLDKTVSLLKTFIPECCQKLK